MVRLLPHGPPGQRRGGLLHLQGHSHDGDQELLFILSLFISSLELRSEVIMVFGRILSPDPASQLVTIVQYKIKESLLLGRLFVV